METGKTNRFHSDPSPVDTRSGSYNILQLTHHHLQDSQVQVLFLLFQSSESTKVENRKAKQAIL
jgi:hypothetical protein